MRGRAGESEALSLAARRRLLQPKDRWAGAADLGLKPPKEKEPSAKPSIHAELLTLRSEFETSSATYEREIEGLKQLESLLDKQGRKQASLPPSHVPASSTDGRATLNAPVSTPDQHVTLDHGLLPRNRLPTWAPVPVRWSEPLLSSQDQSQDRSQMKIQPREQEGGLEGDHTHRSKERGKEPLGQAALAPVEPLGLDRCMQVLTTAPRPALHVEPLGLERWKEERDALDTALGRLVGRRCTDAELTQALELLLAREETDGAPLPSTTTAATPATATLPANSPAPPLSEIQPEILPEPPPESAASARVPTEILPEILPELSPESAATARGPRKTRELQRRLSGYRGVFSNALGTAPDPKLEPRAALATALDTKPEGVKRAVNLGLFSRVVASWGHRGDRGGLRRDRDRDAARDSIRDTARAAPRSGGYTGGFSRGMMLEASSAEAEAEAEAEATKAAKAAKAAELPARAEIQSEIQGAELPARAEIQSEIRAEIQSEIQAEIQSETLAATHAAVPEGEAPPPATPLRALSAPASHVTASHATTSHVTASHATTSNGASNGGGTSPQIHDQMHCPRGLQLLALRPAEVVCLDDDGLPMRIVWDEAGHPVRSPVAAVGAGAPYAEISTDAEADKLLPRSPSRLCLDFLSDALVSLPRSPSRLQLDDDVDGVAAAAGAGVHEVASKAWSAILGVWWALARSVLHADADTSVGTVADTSVEVGSVIAPADGPQRFPLGTADKLRGAALDLVLGRFVRKLCNLALSRAFNSWAERWGERTYAMARVRACAGRVALQRLVDAFGFWAWPPEWVWKSLEYHDEVCNQGRDISWIEVPWVVPWVPKGNRMAYRQCLGLCLADARASIATLRYVHTRRSPLATCHAAVESSLVLRSSLRTCIPHMPHAGVESR